MYTTGGEEVVLCPYNRYHVVKKLRIQKHILKCKQNYPEMKLASCVYNCTHMLKPEEVLNHYEICPHKIRLHGARYETNDFSSSSSEKSDQHSIHFPDLKLKARILPDKFSQMDHSDSQEVDSSSSGSDLQHNQSKSSSIVDDNCCEGEDDLEPLPLPKTVSKAFVCLQQEPKKFELPKTSTPKGFGRGKNFLLDSPPKPPRSTAHLLPDLNGTECGTVNKKKSSWFSRNFDRICSQSLTSSMFDVTTLKSVDMTLDEDPFDDNFIFEGLNNYVKI